MALVDVGYDRCLPTSQKTQSHLSYVFTRLFLAIGRITKAGCHQPLAERAQRSWGKWFTTNG